MKNVPCGRATATRRAGFLEDALNVSFDRLRTNGKFLMPLLVSLSKHNGNRVIQGIRY